MAAIGERHGKLPANPREEIMDRRTKLRYDVDPDGKFRFSWYDPKLEDERHKWVEDHA
jgi:hypothetical protein